MSTSAMPTIADQLFAALESGAVMAQHFPMLLRDGVPDVGPTVHSHFLTLLATTGQSLGFAAVSECPVTWAEEYSQLGDIRPDSVWFDNETLRPRVVIEFERFERGDEGDLRKKVENLVIASHGSHDISLALLVYWVRSGSAPRSMESIVASYRDGFIRRGHHVRSSRSPLMIVKCVMRPASDVSRLLFAEFLRDTRNERLALGRN